VEPDRPVEADRIVFVCTRNSARSPIAAALWEHARPDVPAASAGTEPASSVHPLAVRAAADVGLTIRHAPQHMAGVMREGDLVVTVCDRAHEDAATRRGLPAGTAALHWSVPDPVIAGRPEAFAEAVTMLQERVDSLAAATTRDTGPTRTHPAL
jgi:ArsR family transcriptional regulator, arsenate/arsenite/antimonite-responsive transcriptional repressor / arsenate reductase (thioredoxin)